MDLIKVDLRRETKKDLIWVPSFLLSTTSFVVKIGFLRFHSGFTNIFLVLLICINIRLKPFSSNVG